MSILKLSVLLSFATTLLSTSAFADSGSLSSSGVFLEPAVTYEMGKTSVDYPSPLSNSTGNSDGLGVGARIGIHIYEIFFAGIDGRYSRPHFKDSALGYGATADSTNLGPVVGLQTPVVGLRVWASYVMAGDLDPSGSSNVDVKFSNAKGYRIGAGFRVSVVSLNLEYQQLKYDNATLQKIGPFNANSTFNNVHLNNDSWLASVSFPLEL